MTQSEIPQSNHPDSLEFLLSPVEWIYIPSGSVNVVWTPYNNQGLQTRDISEFYIAKYPITNAQYRAYIRDGGRKPKTKLFQDSRFNNPLQPVIDILWQEAMMFCDWLSEKANFLITLPTDVQWQRAAQGDDSRKYPWGNDWITDYCNTEDNGIGQTTDVTRYPDGASPYGVMDMVGNVWEWCLTEPKTGKNSLEFTKVDMREERMFKGGSYIASKGSVEVFKYGASPIEFPYLTGIRLVTTVRTQ